ncbi:putative Gibberellin-regulated family protein [Hibiscus syriacus]|uniref:Gibberellin-regulated family protein n=1 Tax=Hibiscus syriacus TaxID=106335 RepID=A0A6A3BSV0_HIBSY|nr:putative Gibberellin-regulated family protein [Hibiscus syriacus]
MGSTAISSDGEEEALSLCDLPLENQFQPRSQPIKTDEDFNFGSFADSVGSEMCSADQVFFKGLILPLYGLPGCHHIIHNTSSWSESMHHGSLSKFTSDIHCKYNKEPSPKTHIRSPRTRSVNVGIRNSTSSMWGIFRSGLVRAPEIELQDSKVRRRNSVSCRNSKLVNSNNGGVVSKKRIMGVYSGCKCSVNVVETVPSNNIVFINNEKQKTMLLSAMEERKKLQQELKKKKMKDKEKEKGKGKASLLTNKLEDKNKVEGCNMQVSLFNVGNAMGNFMGKGLPSTQMLSHVFKSLYEQFTDSDIKNFDDFHAAILVIFNVINSALPGKHYDAPSRYEVEKCFEDWKKEEDPEKKKAIFIDFIRTITLSKLDNTTIMTGIVTTPAAMAAKRAGEFLPHLSMIKRCVKAMPSKSVSFNDDMPKVLEPEAAKELQPPFPLD